MNKLSENLKKMKTNIEEKNKEIIEQVNTYKNILSGTSNILDDIIKHEQVGSNKSTEYKS